MLSRWSAGLAGWAPSLAVSTLILGLALALMGPSLAVGNPALARPPAPLGPGAPRAATQTSLAAAYGKLPLAFEANRGQVDSRMDFVARGPGYLLQLSPGEAALALRAPAPGEGLGARERGKAGAPASEAVLRLRLVGSDPAVQAEGQEQLAGTANYLLGADPGHWRTQVPTYAQVQYAGVYPGVDLLYYGTQGQLEYDFALAPGVDAAQIRLQVQGVERIDLADDGGLMLRAGTGALRQGPPIAYQAWGGERHTVPARYLLRDGDEIGIAVGEHNPRLPLVIDPTLVYGTYLGGGGLDEGFGIAADANGNAYVTGLTYSADFPTTASPLDGTLGGTYDAFVAKLNPSGSGLVYSTYLGGSGLEVGYGIALDSSGDAYVVGNTTSADFPTTAGAFDRVLGGSGDAFVAKLNPSGSDLVYSTYLGGGSDDDGLAIVLDAAGNAYLTGDTSSSDFPTTAGAFDRSYGGGGPDAFVAKLNPSGSDLVYSTYLGGSDRDVGYGITFGTAGNIFVTGYSASSNFPTTAGAFDRTYAGGWDAFVAKLNVDGSALLYSTYLGGSGGDEGHGIVVDSGGNAYVAGFTNSSNLPTTAGAFDRSHSGPFHDAFVAKLNPAGSALVYSTYLGGGGDDTGTGVYVDAAGDAYVTGHTISTDFPTTSDAFDRTSGGMDAYVTELNPAGSALVYSTYLGGGGADDGQAIAFDTAGNAYLSGYTGSTDFPTTVGAFDRTFGGGSYDGFVAKLAFGLPYLRTEDTASPPIVYAGSWPTRSDSRLSGGTAHYSSASSASASFTFTGTDVRLITETGPLLGKARVTLDGQATDVDLYSATWQFQLVKFERTGLAAGQHTLVLKPTGTKNAASSGFNVPLDAIDHR